MVGLWRRMSEGAASKEQHNSCTCTCESFAVIHGFFTATSTPDRTATVRV